MHTKTAILRRFISTQNETKVSRVVLTEYDNFFAIVNTINSWIMTPLPYDVIGLSKDCPNYRYNWLTSNPHGTAINESKAYYINKKIIMCCKNGLVLISCSHTVMTFCQNLNVLFLNHIVKIMYQFWSLAIFNLRFHFRPKPLFSH